MRYVSTWFPASSPAPTAKRKNYTVNQVNSRYSLTDPLFTYEKRRLDRKSQVLRNEKIHFSDSISCLYIVKPVP